MNNFYSGTSIIICKKYYNLFNKSVINVNKEIITLKRKIKFILNQFKILNIKFILNKEIHFKININNIISILENKNILNKSIYIIKNNLFNYIKSFIIVLNNEINNINNINYVNDIIYIGNFIINISLNDLILYENINNIENKIIIVKDLSLIYILKFIFLNIICIIIDNKKNNNLNKYLLNNFYIIFKINNIFKIIKNNDYIIINCINNKIYINPSSIKINNIYNN